jgi:two-component system, OmpR family, sensor histidine kinase BaeS
MRLRLVHKLSLLLIAVVLMAVLAMGAVAAWNLKSGFADYLEARDAERLEQFATLAAELIEQSGGLAAFRARSPDMRELLDQFGQRQGLQKRRPPLPRGEGGPRPDGPPTEATPPGGPDGFGPRVNVVGVDGNPIFDRPMPRNPSRFIDRPIRVRGEVVALARLRERGRVSDAVEGNFLRKQYLGIFAVSGSLVLLALVSAWWVARRWAQPLQAVQDAAARIARGEFDVRVAVNQGDAGRSDEIGDLVRDINKMAEGLQHLERARRRWMADISHELRTPLAVLQGEIEALVDGVRPLKPEAVLSLRDEVLQLSSLVNDLHLLAMSDLDALPCQFAEIDAVKLVQQIAYRFEARATSAGLTIGIKLDGAHTIPVCWDHTRIEQLLGNLLENSLRYTDAPGHIMLTLKRAGDQITIDVEDSAPGVPAADLPHLFEPLYRADATRGRHRGGSGLGLAICEAIVKSHGGRIEASLSALGGLRVHIALPVNAEDAT